ncbi:MAG: XTP/dITP diphosphatase [Eubacteriales bacterium]|nr:XTP/dITP diphosphatase [Eubacteriales bacterium]
MTELIIASNNPGKIREMKAILAPWFGQVLSMREAGVDTEVEETGETFAENARLKAQAVCRLSGKPALADDSGLAVDVLGGEPGVYSARYCGRHGDDEANNQKLVREVTPFAPDTRTAHYACTVCLAYPDGRVLEAYGECAGLIRTLPAGTGGFGYDPYFYLPQYGKTMAELPADVKNGMSHRWRALQALLALLEAQK